MRLSFHALLALSLATTSLAACMKVESPTAAKPASSNQPPIFDTRSYADAKAAAETEKKWFIVKATAVWCGPCKQMDATTWIDPAVVAWLKEKAIAVSVDVDQFKPLAKDLRIQGMPTMIAFRDGKEVDRVLGYRSATEFLTWLEGIEKGARDIDRAEQAAGPRDPKDGPVNVQAQYKLAQSLVASGELEKATEQFVWLWENSVKLNPSFGPVRGSFVVGDIQRLIAQRPEAKVPFLRLRDAAAERVAKATPSADDVMEFVALNKIVGDQTATLTWFDSVKGDEKMSKTVLPLVRTFVRNDLIAAERWADLGSILLEPAGSFESMWKAMVGATKQNASGPGADPRLLDAMKSSLRNDAAIDYASLLAAQRDADALALAKKVIEVDPSNATFRHLIDQALLINQPRASQLELLKNAPADAGDLSTLIGQVEMALVAQRSKGG